MNFKYEYMKPRSYLLYAPDTGAPTIPTDLEFRSEIPVFWQFNTNNVIGKAIDLECHEGEIYGQIYIDEAFKDQYLEQLKDGVLMPAVAMAHTGNVATDIQAVSLTLATEEEKAILKAAQQDER